MAVDKNALCLGIKEIQIWWLSSVLHEKDLTIYKEAESS